MQQAILLMLSRNDSQSLQPRRDSYIPHHRCLPLATGWLPTRHLRIHLQLALPVHRGIKISTDRDEPVSMIPDGFPQVLVK